MGLRILRIGSVLIAIWIATACGSGESAADMPGDPIRIGLISQEEELIAFPEISIAAETAVSYVNAELSGVEGTPIAVDVCTVGDTPESVIACAQEFANDDGVRIVLMGTVNAAAGNDTLVGVGKPVLTLVSDMRDITTPGVWAFDPGSPVLAAGLLEFSANELGATTFGLLGADDPSTAEVLVPLLDALAEPLGLTRAGDPITVPLEGDPAGPVKLAADNAADVLLAVVDASQCVPIADAADSLGLSIPKIAADTCMTSEVISSGSLDGWYGISVCEAPIAPDRRTDGTFSHIVRTYGDGDPRLDSSFGCWAVANVIVAAEVLAEAGGAGATNDSIAQALDAYSSDSLPAYPPVSCPGPAPFLGACLRTATIVRVEGNEAVPEALVPVDLTRLGLATED